MKTNLSRRKFLETSAAAAGTLVVSDQAPEPEEDEDTDQ